MCTARNFDAFSKALLILSMRTWRRDKNIRVSYMFFLYKHNAHKHIHAQIGIVLSVAYCSALVNPSDNMCIYYVMVILYRQPFKAKLPALHYLNLSKTRQSCVIS